MTRKKKVQVEDFDFNAEMGTERTPEEIAAAFPAPEPVGIQVSEDGYLLQKVVPADKIKRVVDWKSLGITPLSIQKSVSLKYSWMDDKGLAHDDRARPDPDNEQEMDRFYVTELCHPYNPKPDGRDVFVYYYDIVPLSGTAGYIRIRDGYVHGRTVVWCS